MLNQRSHPGTTECLAFLWYKTTWQYYEPYGHFFLLLKPSWFVLKLTELSFIILWKPLAVDDSIPSTHLSLENSELAWKIFGWTQVSGCFLEESICVSQKNCHRYSGKTQLNNKRGQMRITEFDLENWFEQLWGSHCDIFLNDQPLWISEHSTFVTYFTSLTIMTTT